MAAKLTLAKKTGERIVPVGIYSDDRLDANYERKVFIYSFSGYQARVIQAHYEHPHFIVRKTEHFVFEEGSVHAFKLMLRWMMNTPTGDVKMSRGSVKRSNAHKLSGSGSLVANENHGESERIHVGVSHWSRNAVIWR
jgi:hypothetical protein